MKRHRFIKRVHNALATIGLVLACAAAPAQTEPLVVVADEWPPFSGAALPDKGLSLDVITAVLTEAGYNVDASVVPWARIMGDAEIGQFDIIGSLFADADLERYLHYSDPFYITEVQLVERAGGSYTYSGIADLRAYAIAVGDGFLYQDEFDRAQDLNKIIVTTTLQAVQMVAAGRADLTLDSVDVIRHVITQDDPSLGRRVRLVPGVMARQGIHMAVRRDLDGSARIVADFNAALARMQADGRLAQLLSRHVQK